MRTRSLRLAVVRSALVVAGLLLAGRSGFYGAATAGVPLIVTTFGAGAAIWASVAAARDQGDEILRGRSPGHFPSVVAWLGAIISVSIGTLILTLVLGVAVLPALGWAMPRALTAYWSWALLPVAGAASLGFAAGRLCRSPVGGIVVAGIWLMGAYPQTPFIEWLRLGLAQNTLLTWGVALALLCIAWRAEYRGVRPAWALNTAAAGSVAILLLGGVGATLVQSRAHSGPGSDMPDVSPVQARLGEMIPGFSVAGASSRPLRSSDYAGRVIVLAFFAPSDPRSGPLLSAMTRLQREVGARGLQVIAVGCDQDSGYRTLLPRLGLPFPVAFERTERRSDGAFSALLSAYRVRSLPVVVLTDRRRRLRDVLTLSDYSLLSGAIRERLEEEPE